MRWCVLLLPGLLAATADRLPDMRWLFERALRYDARGDLHRYDRVRAWALVPLLYPHDEPGTENDEVWRLIARAALARLDASAAGYPPPGEPQRQPRPASDPLRDLLGVELASEADGTVRVRAADPASGLRPGDRIRACAGRPVGTPREVAEALAAPRLDLALADGRTLVLRLAPGQPALPLALGWVASVAAWERPRRWRLPAIDGAWLVAGEGPAQVDGRTPLPAPGAAGWTAVATTEIALMPGNHAIRATSLRGAWQAASARLVVGVRAGAGLVVETDGPPHALLVTGVDGSAWHAGAPATTHRLVRHGPAGALAEHAIERNGMVVVGVRPLAGPPAAVRVRILLPDPGAAP